MTSDLTEMYRYVFLPDGQKIYSPENCVVCQSVKEDHPFSYGVCPICGHLYHDVSNTDNIYLQGKCWCEVLVIKKIYIKKQEDYPEFWKKCLLESLEHLEIIQEPTCDDCEIKELCEDGGTNIQGIKDTICFCEDIIL